MSTVKKLSQIKTTPNIAADMVFGHPPLGLNLLQQRHVQVATPDPLVLRDVLPNSELSELQIGAQGSQSATLGAYQ